jgi:hypothetical protein
MKNRRFGTFTISRKMIETHPEIVKRIMGECIIVRAEMSYVRDAFEYTAISDWFDEVSEAAIPMEYGILFTKDGNNIKWAFTTFLQGEYK